MISRVLFGCLLLNLGVVFGVFADDLLGTTLNVSPNGGGALAYPVNGSIGQNNNLWTEPGDGDPWGTLQVGSGNYLESSNQVMTVGTSNSAAFSSSSLILGSGNALHSAHNSLVVGTSNTSSWFDGPQSALIVGSHNHVQWQTEGFVVVGSYNVVANSYGIVAGVNNAVEGALISVFGRGLIATWSASSSPRLIVGQYNEDFEWNAIPPVFTVGNGTSATVRSNAFEIYPDGHARLRGTLTAAPGGDLPMYSGN